jgi:orotate phosphoribosyltransferase
MSELERTLADRLGSEDVLPRMKELEAILEGHFKLSSGRHSNLYFQCALILQFPGLASDLGQLIAQQFDELEIDCVLSAAVGGLVIGQEVARGLGRRHLFAERKAELEGGGFQLRRGFRLEKGENVLVVDDVLTRGTSFEELSALVREHECRVVGLGVIVDRREADVTIDAPVRSLVQMQVQTWPAENCELCERGVPLYSPGSRHGV